MRPSITSLCNIELWTPTDLVNKCTGKIRSLAEVLSFLWSVTLAKHVISVGLSKMESLEQIASGSFEDSLKMLGARIPIREYLTWHNPYNSVEIDGIIPILQMDLFMMYRLCIQVTCSVIELLGAQARNWTLACLIL